MSKNPPLCPTLMIQGTGSSVGKSLLTAGFCRLFANLGYRVAPYKAQNMALNAYTTPDGLEIGRAQATQAWAARQEVHVDMNPVLLKPQPDQTCQVILMGKPTRQLSAREYETYKPQIRETVLGALERLRRSNDLVIIEGAGSPAEINLRNSDIVNMFIATSVESPVLLVGDIDKGGVFASLYGTLELLEVHERARIAGFLINKFRGDRSILEPGLRMIEDRCGVPVLGVIDMIDRLALADEDSHTLQRTDARLIHKTDKPLVCIVRYPGMSNIDDYLALQLDPEFDVYFIDHIPTATPDIVILPGSKSTVSDLAWMRTHGFDDWLSALARDDATSILGICGGCQMLGNTIFDPGHYESLHTSTEALGLLDIDTHFSPHKHTHRIRVRIDQDPQQCEGYEIRMGNITPGNDLEPWMWDKESPQGWKRDRIHATMVHGLFDHCAMRNAMLKWCNRPVQTHYNFLAEKDQAIEHVADILARHTDISAIQGLIQAQCTS